MTPVYDFMEGYLNMAFKGDTLFTPCLNYPLFEG